RVAIDRASVGCARDRPEEAAGRRGLEDHRHLAGLRLARAEAAEGAARGLAADGLRRQEVLHVARAGVPVILLFLVAAYGHGGRPEGQRRAAFILEDAVACLQ